MHTKILGKVPLTPYKSLEQFIQTVKRSEQCLKQDALFTSSWRFLRSDTLEQLEFKLENIFGM